MANASVQDIISGPFFKEPFNNGYNNGLEDCKNWLARKEIFIPANIFDDHDNSLLDDALEEATEDTLGIPLMVSTNQ